MYLRIYKYIYNRYADFYLQFNEIKKTVAPLCLDTQLRGMIMYEREHGL